MTVIPDLCLCGRPVTYAWRDHWPGCPSWDEGNAASQRFGMILDGVAECGLPVAYVTGAKDHKGFVTDDPATGKPNMSLVQGWTVTLAWASGTGPAWLYLHSSEPGLGKTHLAASALATVIREGSTGRFTKLGPMLRELMSCAMDEKLLAFRKFSRTRNLVIDEVGAEKASDYTISQLSELIDERYELGRRTIITSNLSLAELAVKFTPQGEGLSAKRIVDRIFELTGGSGGAGRVEFKGRSWRKQ